MSNSSSQNNAVALMAVPGVIYNPDSPSLNKGPFQATGFSASFAGDNTSCSDYDSCKSFNNRSAAISATEPREILKVELGDKKLNSISILIEP